MATHTDFKFCCPLDMLRPAKGATIFSSLHPRKARTRVGDDTTRSPSWKFCFALRITKRSLLLLTAFVWHPKPLHATACTPLRRRHRDLTTPVTCKLSLTGRQIRIKCRPRGDAEHVVDRDADGCSWRDRAEGLVQVLVAFSRK